jgi:hypothetical protein
VTRELGEQARALYLPDGDYRNPHASVAFADHTRLPPGVETMDAMIAQANKHF